MDAAAIEKICELQRSLDMTERLIGDCLIILCDKDPNHRTVEYNEVDVPEVGKHLISMCYYIAEELQKSK